LIVDDELLARRGVALRLKRFRDVEIVGECGDGSSAVEKILELSPDVVFSMCKCQAWTGLKF